MKKTIFLSLFLASSILVRAQTVTVSGSGVTDQTVTVIQGYVGMDETNIANSLKVFPNPYSNYTNIQYYLQKSSKVNIEIYNIVGKKVAEIVNDKQKSGTYKYQFSAKALGYSEGLYLLRFRVDGREIIRKFVEVR